jgi:iron complex transport system substrate-binding protein
MAGHHSSATPRLAGHVLRRLALAVILACLAAPLRAAGVQLQDDAGRITEWRSPPQRIITMIPSLTETVCELGACDRLVGVDRYSNYPEQVKSLPRLGGLDDSNIEAIVALRPDVVLAASSSRIAERLTGLGVKVVTLDTKSHEDVQRVLGKVGTLLGVTDAQRVWRHIDAGVGAAAQSLPPEARGALVYYEIDSAPYAAGEASFMGQTLKRLGARNIVAAAMGPFPKINPEFVVRANPQLIMIGQRNLAGLYTRPGWQQIEALRKRQVCVFTPEQSDVLTRPGPRMAQGAQIMARCLRAMSGKSTSP